MKKSTLLLSLILLTICGFSQINFCFESAASPVYTTTIKPNSVAKADFNGDGKTDLVATGSNSVSVLLGDGTGAFTAAQTFSATNAGDVVVADFNGDSFPDFAISAIDPAQRVLIFIGNGNGNFNPPVNVPANYLPTSITSADVNNDGNKDIVLGFGSTNLMTLIGNGTGGFLSPIVYTTPYTTVDITSADINKDGYDDIIGINQSLNIFMTFISNGSGSFSSCISYTVGAYPLSVKAVDVNGDSYEDIIVANTNSNSISVSLNNGSGNFNPPIFYRCHSGPSKIEYGDINTDGVVDIITYNTWSDDVSVLLGLGNGTFGEPIAYSLSINNNSAAGSVMVLGDFNNDGMQDVVVMNWHDSYVYFYKGIGNGRFGGIQDYPLYNRSLDGIVTTHLNNDSYLDMVVANVDTSFVTVFLGLPNGKFSIQPAKYAVANKPTSLAVADFNNDGKNDLAVGSNTNTTSSNISILLGDGIGGFGPATYLNSGLYPIVFAADINNDNNQDLVLGCKGSNAIMIFLGNGSGAFTQGTSISLTSLGLWGIVDFNNDGKKDLLASTTSGSDNIKIYKGNGNGTFSASSQFLFAAGGSIYTTGDFNKDGKQDFVIAEKNTNSVKVYTGDGLATFSLTATLPYGATGTHIKTVDFDSDGNLDLMVPSFKGFFTFRGSNNGIFTQENYISTGDLILGICSGDFSGDAFEDIALTLNGKVAVLMNRSGGILPVATTTLCNGAMLTLNASIEATNALWQPSGINSNSLIVTQSGTYSVVTQNTNQTCTSTSKGITINFSPQLSIYSNKAGICLGDSVSLSASGGITYTWNNGATTNSIVVTPSLTTNFSVIGADINNCMDTLSFQINVETPPLISITDTLICSGSSITINTNGAITYTWSNGATTPYIIDVPVSTNIYSISAASLLGCTTAASYTVTVDPTCADVWPGDANSDGTTDNLDVLELGLHYTQTGLGRSTISNVWQSYTATNWTGTITNGKNLNHSDCNGDGTIDANDTLAIYNNYGLTHAFKQTAQPLTNPQLSIVPDQPMVVKGNWGTASIYLGDASNQIWNVNGIAFTVDFDHNLIETNNIWLEYHTSFINSANDNLHFRKLDFTNDKIYTATTHTLNNNVSGFDKIATLHYQIKSNLSSDQVLNLGLSNANHSNTLGNIIALSSGTGTLMAIGASVGINELNNGNLISIVPNPANSFITISSNSAIETIDVMNVSGQVLVSQKTNSTTQQINIEGLANGIYVVKITSVNGATSVKRLVVNR